MTEKDFQKSIIDLAQTFGWKVAHFRTAMNARGRHMTPVAGDGKGYPDLHLVHPERELSVYRELKVGRNKLSPEQAAWGEWLTAAHQDWGVWRPDDMTEIATLLTGGRATVI